MEIGISQTTIIWTIINFVFLLGFLGLGIYVIILVIKALKKYIRKN